MGRGRKKTKVYQKFNTVIHEPYLMQLKKDVDIGLYKTASSAITEIVEKHYEQK
jgi:hypothetical protein